MKALALILAALLSGVANAAYVKSHSAEVLPSMQSVAAPGEVIGFVVCQTVSFYYCGEIKLFEESTYRFADYVKLKVGSDKARIIGYQYSPDDQVIYLYFAVPEEDVPANYRSE